MPLAAQAPSCRAERRHRSALKRCVAPTPSLVTLRLPSLIPRSRSRRRCQSWLTQDTVSLRRRIPSVTKPKPARRCQSVKNTKRQRAPDSQCIRRPTNTRHERAQKRSDAASQNWVLHHTREVGGTGRWALDSRRTGSTPLTDHDPKRQKKKRTLSTSPPRPRWSIEDEGTSARNG